MAASPPPSRNAIEATRASFRSGKVEVDIEGGDHPFLDLYYYLLTTSWTKLIGLLFLIYLVANAAFAALYMLEPGCVSGLRPGSWADRYFFSVQAMTTVGFGTWAPATTWGHVLVTIETFSGLLGFATATGLVFARFSRPSARILFSTVAVVQQHEGVPTLFLRMFNARRNLIVEAEVHATAVVDEISPEGMHMRRIRDVALIRHQSPVFVLGWTVMHPIVPGSPLHGRSREEIEAQIVGLVFAVSGIDESYGQVVHGRTVLTPADIRWGEVYEDVVVPGAEGRLRMDLTAIDKTRPQGLVD